MITRWKITIEYDGTNYAGWQRQIDGVPTVQESIETAIQKFSGQFVRIHAAGRTDAGVHAAGQVAHFDFDYGGREITGFEMAKAINAFLIRDKIAILKAEPVHSNFHARFDATLKTYRYRILNRRAAPTFDTNIVWHCKKILDENLMQDGANFLIGHHDFSSFRAQDCQAKHPNRSIDVARVTRTGDHIDFIFEGRSFLHHQVRNMVGSLVLVGQKKWVPQKIYEVLMAKNRALAGPTAPPQGLTLVQILYPNQ